MRIRLAVTLLSGLVLVGCGSPPSGFGFNSSSHGALATASAGAAAGLLFKNAQEQLSFERLPRAAGAAPSTFQAFPSGRRALATDGERFVACWEDNGRVGCGRAGEGARFELEGHAPSLAYDSGTWLLSYQDKDEVGVLQRLGDDVQPQGEPLRPFSTEPGLVSVGAAQGGFAVAGGAPLRLKRLRADLSPQGAEVTLDSAGAVIWQLSVAASGSRVIVSHHLAYGNTLYVIDGERLVRHFFMGGGGKLGLEVALAAEEDSIVAAWAGDVARWTFASTAAPFDGLPRTDQASQGETAGVVGVVLSEGKLMRVNVANGSIDLTPIP